MAENEKKSPWFNAAFKDFSKNFRYRVDIPEEGAKEVTDFVDRWARKAGESHRKRIKAQLEQWLALACYEVAFIRSGRPNAGKQPVLVVIDTRTIGLRMTDAAQVKLCQEILKISKTSKTLGGIPKLTLMAMGTRPLVLKEEQKWNRAGLSYHLQESRKAQVLRDLRPGSQETLASFIHRYKKAKIVVVSGKTRDKMGKVSHRGILDRYTSLALTLGQTPQRQPGANDRLVYLWGGDRPEGVILASHKAVEDMAQETVGAILGL